MRCRSSRGTSRPRIMIDPAPTSAMSARPRSTVNTFDLPMDSTSYLVADAIRTINSTHNRYSALDDACRQYVDRAIERMLSMLVFLSGANPARGDVIELSTNRPTN